MIIAIAILLILCLSLITADLVHAMTDEQIASIDRWELLIFRRNSHKQPTLQFPEVPIPPLPFGFDAKYRCTLPSIFRYIEERDHTALLICLQYGDLSEEKDLRPALLHAIETKNVKAYRVMLHRIKCPDFLSNFLIRQIMDIERNDIAGQFAMVHLNSRSVDIGFDYNQGFRWACSKQLIDVIKMYLHRQRYVLFLREELLTACSDGKVEVVKLLINRGKRFRGTCMIEAAKYGHKSTMEALMAQVPSENDRENLKRALGVAVQSEKQSVIELTLASDMRPPISEIYEMIGTACKDRRYQSLETLLMNPSVDILHALSECQIKSFEAKHSHVFLSVRMRKYGRLKNISDLVIDGFVNWIIHEKWRYGADVSLYVKERDQAIDFLFNNYVNYLRRKGKLIDTENVAKT